MARVAVLVVTYNSRRFLARMLASLAAQSFRDWRLILVDNASRLEERPTPADFADMPPGVTLVQNEENLGFAAANNQAAALAPEAEFLALLNPDAFADPDWLETLVDAAMRRSGIALFGSTQCLDADPTILDGGGDVMHALGVPYRARLTPVADILPEGETFGACAAAMLARNEVWRAFGGFDARLFSYCEDVDLAFRLRLAGWGVAQIPAARVRHVGGGTAGDASDFAMRLGARNRLLVFARNAPALLFWPILPAHLLLTAALVCAKAARRRSLAPLRGLAEGLRGLPRALGERRPASLRATLAVARVLAWSPFRLVDRRQVVRRYSAASTSSA